MRWNTLALECQLFLDVDCSSLTYSSPVHPQVASAATQLWHKQHGWADEEDKKRKILALPRFAEYMRKIKEGSGPGGADQEFVDKTYADWMAGKGASPCSVFNKNYKADCRVATIEAEIAPNQWNGTTNRTQTIEESLDESLLGVLIPLEGSSRASQSATNVTDEILKEALCRDLEAFDEVFEVDDLDHRPEYCPPIKNSMCAVLYDSSSCMEGTWKLEVTSGTQKQLLYWSSDFKYRNDADIVAVRNGCTFTGWTGSGYDGETFTVTAGPGLMDRWIVFSKSSHYKKFDESILSFQCNCRGQD